MIAPVAQLDRVPGYEPGGRRFESFRARHFKKEQRCSFFLRGGKVRTSDTKEKQVRQKGRIAFLDVQSTPAGRGRRTRPNQSSRARHFKKEQRCSFFLRGGKVRTSDTKEKQVRQKGRIAFLDVQSTPAGRGRRTRPNQSSRARHFKKEQRCSFFLRGGRVRTSDTKEKQVRQKGRIAFLDVQSTPSANLKKHAPPRPIHANSPLKH